MKIMLNHIQPLYDPQKQCEDLDRKQNIVIISLQSVSLLISICLILVCAHHSYKYVYKAPKNKRPISLTLFYITAFITIFGLVGTCMFVRTFQKHP